MIPAFAVHLHFLQRATTHGRGNAVNENKIDNYGGQSKPDCCCSRSAMSSSSILSLHETCALIKIKYSLYVVLKCMLSAHGVGERWQIFLFVSHTQIRVASSSRYASNSYRSPNGIKFQISPPNHIKNEKFSSSFAWKDGYSSIYIYIFSILIELCDGHFLHSHLPFMHATCQSHHRNSWRISHSVGQYVLLHCNFDKLISYHYYYKRCFGLHFCGICEFQFKGSKNHELKFKINFSFTDRRLSDKWCNFKYKTVASMRNGQLQSGTTVSCILLHKKISKTFSRKKFSSSSSARMNNTLFVHWKSMHIFKTVLSSEREQQASKNKNLTSILMHFER